MILPMHIYVLNALFCLLRTIICIFTTCEPRVRFGASKIGVNPTVVFTTDRTKAVVLVCCSYLEAVRCGFYYGLLMFLSYRCV